MNELQIWFNDEWMYFKTYATNIDDAINDYNTSLEGIGIDLCDMCPRQYDFWDKEQNHIATKVMYYEENMNPVRIDHANIYDNEKRVVVELQLSREDREEISIYNTETYGDTYDISDVSMLVWVLVIDNKVIKVDYAAYYPEDKGERDYPVELISKNVLNECIQFVNENYFGNEDKYDDRG